MKAFVSWFHCSPFCRPNRGQMAPAIWFVACLAVVWVRLGLQAGPDGCWPRCHRTGFRPFDPSFSSSWHSVNVYPSPKWFGVHYRRMQEDDHKMPSDKSKHYGRVGVVLASGTRAVILGGFSRQRERVFRHGVLFSVVGGCRRVTLG